MKILKEIFLLRTIREYIYIYIYMYTYNNMEKIENNIAMNIPQKECAEL